MPYSNIKIMLAEEADAASLASIMTAAFSASDLVYPLIWSSQAAAGIHDIVAIKGLFTPVQRSLRTTYKAMDGDQIAGFATWALPDANAPKKTLSADAGEMKKSMGLPDIPGVNTTLWRRKQAGASAAAERDVELSEDMFLSLLFVHPDHQRQGVGSLLLRRAIQEAQELKAKIWLTSTPQAVTVYEKSGWKIVEKLDVDLSEHGGSGVYSRAWMVRLPAAAI